MNTVDAKAPAAPGGAQKEAAVTWLLEETNKPIYFAQKRP